MDTLYTCEVCGGKHRIMEICTERPGALALLRAWYNGDQKDLMSWIAVVGVGTFLFLAVLGLAVAQAG